MKKTLLGKIRCKLGRHTAISKCTTDGQAIISACRYCDKLIRLDYNGRWTKY